MSTLLLMLIMVSSFCGGVLIDRYPWFIPSPYAQNNQEIEMTQLNASNQAVTVQPGSGKRDSKAGGEVGDPIFDTERDLSCIDTDHVSVLLQRS
jgi:hypothetical protein